MPADKDEEVFELVDENNEVVGRELRGVCHARGLRHRAVYCFVFDSREQLLLQQRSTRKKTDAGKWDLSLAEHLQPGESYLSAVVRGLREELGIEAELSELDGPLAPAHIRVLDIPGVIKDVEYVQAYRLNGWAGSLKLDPEEVQAVKWMPLEAIYNDIETSPEKFTSWLCGELAMMKRYFLERKPFP